MARTKPTWDFITKEATSDERLSVKDSVSFHCFNPNGLYAKLKDIHERVSQWCMDHPDRPNGILLVHGSLNDYPRKRLFELLDKKRITSMELILAKDWVKSDISDAEEWLSDESKWPERKNG